MHGETLNPLAYVPFSMSATEFHTHKKQGEL